MVIRTLIDVFEKTNKNNQLILSSDNWMESREEI